MNGVRYRKRLEDNKLKMHMDIHECNMFIQDGVPCHHLQLVIDFLKKKNIKTLDWPGNNSDLNSIENFWAILKDKMADEHPTSAKDMEMAKKTHMHAKITAEYCKHLVHSMPCRLQAVIKNKGGHTKC